MTTTTPSSFLDFCLAMRCTHALFPLALYSPVWLLFCPAHPCLPLRAIKTAWGALTVMEAEYLPTTAAWQLNERMYGLAGLTPQEAYDKHGKAQVHAWARALDEAPPEVAAGGPCDPRADTDKCVE